MRGPGWREDGTKVTLYQEPSGWKHIQAAYHGITAKLDEQPGNRGLRRQAIKYCQDRLNEDLDSIEAGGEPLVSPS